MRSRFSLLLVAALIWAPLSSAAINTLTVATATTSTGDTGIVTDARRQVNASVWNTAGTATVALEEQLTDTAGAGPWTLVVPMVNCSSTGIDASSVPCAYKTMTPGVRTRLRVTACSGCSVKRIIETIP